MKKLYIYIALLCAGLSFQSCLFEEKDIFDKSASERITEAVSETHEILKSAKNGWLLEYCPGIDYSMGGINMIVKFDSDKATLSSELGGSITPAGTSCSSYYRVIAEQSVVLTFDTYNDVIHYFGEPQGSNANMQGDYEFVVMKASEDEVILQGKRYKNLMKMTPLNIASDWNSLITLFQRVQSNAFLNSYELFVDGRKIGTTTRSGNTNVFTINSDNGITDTNLPFIYTTNGFRLLKPFSIDGVDIINFEWKTTADEAGTFISVDENAPVVELRAYYPDDYRYYTEYLGTYEMEYEELMFLDNEMYFESRKVDVQLTKQSTNSTYTISGMPDVMGDMVVAYDRASGNLAINSGSYVSTFNGYYIYQNIGSELAFFPLYYGMSFSLESVVEAENNIVNKIEFKDTGWGEYYFGDNANSVLYEVYTSQSISQVSFYTASACYKNIVLTKK